MGLADKARNKAEELAGQAKEKLGEVTNNDELAREGQAEQVKAKAKQAGEDLKDAGRAIVDDDR